MNRPQAEDYPVFYKAYIDSVSDDVLIELENQIELFSKLLRSIPADKGSYAYAEGKWTVKELIGHIIDTERIMAYRTLRFARNDATPLAGFEENDYVMNANFADSSLENMAQEFEHLRRANLFMIKSLNETELNRTGISNGLPISVKALVFIIAGHLNHHIRILKERYI